MLTSTSGSRHNGALIWLYRWLRTRRFSKPISWLPRATNWLTNTAIWSFFYLVRAFASSFFSLFLFSDLVSFSLILSDSSPLLLHLSMLLDVWLLNSLQHLHATLWVICICMHICGVIFPSICVYIVICIYSYIYIYICMDTCICVNFHICMLTSVQGQVETEQHWANKSGAEVVDLAADWPQMLRDRPSALAAQGRKEIPGLNIFEMTWVDCQYDNFRSSVHWRLWTFMVLQFDLVFSRIIYCFFICCIFFFSHLFFQVM